MDAFAIKNPILYQGIITYFNAFDLPLSCLTGLVNLNEPASLENASNFLKGLCGIYCIYKSCNWSYIHW